MSTDITSELGRTMCYLEKLNDYRGSVLTASLGAVTAMSVVVDTYSVDTMRSTEPKGLLGAADSR